MIRLHQRKVAAPFVLYPHRIEIFGLAAYYHHNLCTVQRSKNVRLILLPQLVLQRNTAEEHFVALFRQAVINVLRPLAVMGALTVRIRLLIADKHVIRLFIRRNRKDALLNLGNLGSLLLIQLAACFIGGMLHRRQIVRIR